MTASSRHGHSITTTYPLDELHGMRINKRLLTVSTVVLVFLAAGGCCRHETEAERIETCARYLQEANATVSHAEAIQLCALHGHKLERN